MAGDINFNLKDDYSDTLLSKAKPFLQGARFVNSLRAKRSITALSKDLIMQFPVLMSAGIDQDKAVIIAKSLERMYAAMYLTVWTADSAFGVDSSMNGVRDFVKRYHNNDDIPDMITYGGNILSLTDQLLGNEATYFIQQNDTRVPATEMSSLWDNTEDQLNMTSINELYSPDKAMLGKIKEITKAIEGEDVEAATEAKGGGSGGGSGGGKNSSHSKPPRDSSSNYKFTTSDTNMTNIGRAALGMMDDSNHINKGYNSTNVVNSFDPKATIVRNDKMTSMEPTLINVTFLVHGGEQGKAYGNEGRNHVVGMRTQQAIVGVKTMIRFISSEYMIPNVISSIQDQSMAFKFVKWTKGEMKVGRDMILGISRIKEDALAGNKADQWFAALRKRRRNAKTFRFTETGLNPFTTLVLTTDEVEQIRQTAGYDITSRNICKKLMDNLYLLGLMIVNVNTGSVESIFDGFNEFSSTTLTAMKESRKDDMITSADQLREIKQIMGRF